MSEMVERVAMAIFETNQREIGGAITPWEEATESAHRISRAMARAAIGALREPTEAMKVAEGVHWDYSCHVCGGIADGWRLMITEALAAN